MALAMLFGQQAHPSRAHHSRADLEVPIRKGVAR